MISFNLIFIIWRGEIRLKLDDQSQGRRRILELDGQGE